jgi:putative DNA primase/helicase
MRTFADLGISYRANGPAEQRLACPRCDHGPRDGALGVNIETGVFHCFRCGWSGHAGIESHAPVIRLDDPAIAERKRERLRRTWAEAVELKDRRAAAVHQYLCSRGLGEILCGYPACLRAHPALPYFEDAREVGRFPAMVAMFTDKAGKPCTLHATYLRHDGCAKAPVATPKKLLGVAVRGASRGGAIRLYRPEQGVLGVCEGIETALSLRLIKQPHIPVWAAGCANNLAALVLPPLKLLYIGIDVDESGSGERRALELSARARPPAVARVRFVTPDGEGPRDLNDELRHRGQK